MMMKYFKSYACSKHGFQGPFVGVEVKLMACWIDMMDDHLEPLGEVKE